MQKLLYGFLFIFLSSCADPAPMSFRVRQGMSRDKVISLLGEPFYSGGFIYSGAPGQKRSPQKDRFLLLYVYPDSSLVVFKKDTVFDRFARMQEFRSHYGRKPNH